MEGERVPLSSKTPRPEQRQNVNTLHHGTPVDVLFCAL